MRTEPVQVWEPYYQQVCISEKESYTLIHIHLQTLYIYTKHFFQTLKIMFYIYYIRYNICLKLKRLMCVGVLEGRQHWELGGCGPWSFPGWLPPFLGESLLVDGFLPLGSGFP